MRRPRSVAGGKRVSDEASGHANQPRSGGFRSHHAPCEAPSAADVTARDDADRTSAGGARRRDGEAARAPTNHRSDVVLRPLRKSRDHAHRSALDRAPDHEQRVAATAPHATSLLGTREASTRRSRRARPRGDVPNRRVPRRRAPRALRPIRLAAAPATGERSRYRRARTSGTLLRDRSAPRTRACAKPHVRPRVAKPHVWARLAKPLASSRCVKPHPSSRCAGARTRRDRRRPEPRPKLRRRMHRAPRQRFRTHHVHVERARDHRRRLGRLRSHAGRVVHGESRPRGRGAPLHAGELHRRLPVFRNAR